MITARAIRNLRTASSDNEETDAIKALMNKRRQDPSGLYLTFDDFNRILRWKLGQQIGRVKRLISQNTPQIVEETTKLALSVQIDDPDYEFQFRFTVLTALRGVGTGVASAILALSFPEKYCVIDYRGWRQVFDDEKTAFSFGEYNKYLGRVRILAKELGWTPQEVDLAIWEYDKRVGKAH
jgi:hypothetical protein